MIIIEEKPDYINSPDALRVLAGIRTLLSSSYHGDLSYPPKHNDKQITYMLSLKNIQSKYEYVTLSSFSLDFGSSNSSSTASILQRTLGCQVVCF